MHMDHLEGYGRPTKVHIGDHIAFRTCLRCANQANSLRKLRERQFVIGIEQALALKLLAQFVDHGLEAATGSDLENRVPAQRQRSALHPQVRFAMNHHAVALNELAGRGREPAEAIDFHGDILEVVAQRDVGRAGATGIDLRDLAGDPRGRPSFHGTVELLAQHTYRPRILRAGFSGACRQLIDRARLIRQIDGALIRRESALTRLKAS